MAIWQKWLIGGVLCALSGTAFAVSGDGWQRKGHGDPDHAAAIAALEREDWRGAVVALKHLLARRSWDEDAHTLLGFAYRRLGRYTDSLAHYERALELNPYHRGALEYLGEAYLELGDAAQARQILARLGIVCRHASRRPSARERIQECTEWRELDAAIRASRSD